MPHYQLNLKFSAKKENLPAKRIQAETMSASLVFQISYYGSIICCQNHRFEMESCSEMRQGQMNCFHLQQVEEKTGVKTWRLKRILNPLYCSFQDQRLNFLRQKNPFLFV
jgi:hypothetical protein